MFAVREALVLLHLSRELLPHTLAVAGAVVVLEELLVLAV
jgi:hypothetical protein